MKAIIMAAGKGSRISAHIGAIPKSLVPLTDGTPILRRHVEMMLDLSIEPVICLGYQKEKIIDALQGLPVRYYINPFFAVTNNIANLWFAEKELDGKEDILLLSGDLYYPASFLKKALEANAPISMFGDSSRIYDGDFYLHIDAAGYVDKYGSHLPLPLRQYEYMGITKIKADFVPTFKNRVKDYIEAERYNTYFEEAALSFSISKEEKIDLVDIAGDFWREFDYYEDYEMILAAEKVEQ